PGQSRAPDEADPRRSWRGPLPCRAAAAAATALARLADADQDLVMPVRYRGRPEARRQDERVGGGQVDSVAEVCQATDGDDRQRFVRAGVEEAGHQLGIEGVLGPVTALGAGTELVLDRRVAAAAYPGELRHGQ